MTSWIVLAVLVAAGLYAVSLYNRLVKNRQMVREGWSGIDVQLKRRADLIPNLLETVKGTMDMGDGMDMGGTETNGDQG